MSYRWTLVHPCTIDAVHVCMRSKYKLRAFGPRTQRSAVYCVNILVKRYRVDPPRRFVSPTLVYAPRASLKQIHEKLTTKFVIAANARMNIKYALVRDTPVSELNVLEESAPERISNRSTPWDIRQHRC